MDRTNFKAVPGISVLSDQFTDAEQRTSNPIPTLFWAPSSYTMSKSSTNRTPLGRQCSTTSKLIQKCQHL